MSAIPSVPAEIPRKPLQGKYDKRKHNKFAHPNQQAGRKLGHKPDWAKNLTRKSAAHVLKRIGLQEFCLQLLASKNERLRFDVLCYLWDRLEGKPFTAVNPEERPQAQTIINDNRLQVAMQTLLPGAKPKAKRKSKAQVIDAQEVAALPATTDDPSSPEAPPRL